MMKKIIASVLAMLQVVTPAISWAQSGPTTTFAYDNVGQLTQTTSPAGRTKALQWDAHGRLSSESQAGSVVGYSYNGQSALVGVTDPRNLTTTYDRNGFGEARTLQSPDTGASTYAYDLNGNLTSRINAAGQTESYTYDAANRVLTKSLSHPTQGTKTYTYTYGTNGTPEAGNLTQISSPGLTLSFAHNLLGQTTSASQQVAGGPVLTVKYGYAANGALTSITYPSGRVVTYGLDSTSRTTSISSGGAPLLSNISYAPFGAVTGWTFGSGQSVTRSYDLNGRITAVTMPGGTREYHYDSDDRITGINDPVLGTATYGYDDLDRLTSADTAVGSWTYQYDATGNRTGNSAGGSSTTVAIDNYSNRVLATSGTASRSYTYTNDGQPRQIDGASPQPNCAGALTFSYQADGQLVVANVLTAVHTPTGLRLQKTAAACAGGATTNFVYDQAGHLVGEYDASGAIVQETIWLGDAPVAVYKPSTAATPFYVYADNLGSPRAITNAAGLLVWAWDGEPFGATAANENPLGQGAFSYNLRFPGQYFDVETGYHHNGWREYDPSLGRYVQSDPLGITSDVTTYTYAAANPLAHTDPLGLMTGVGSAMILVDGAWIAADLAVGNYGGAALGLVGMGADLIPGMPEVFGAGIHALRGLRTADRVADGLRVSKLAHCPQIGGSHGEVRKAIAGMGEFYESHHMPPNSVNGLATSKGPALAMEKADHAQTASYGRDAAAIAYQAEQAALVKAGKFRQAMLRDIADVRANFGNKYDEGIRQMLYYADKMGY